MTRKETFFVAHYCTTFNASEAARKAGYSKSTARQMGYELLTKPYIKDAIQNKTQKSLKGLGVTQEKVIAEIAAIAFSDIGHAFEDDWTLKQVREIPVKDRKAIQAVSSSDKVCAVKMYDKLRALELLLDLLSENS